MKHNTLLCLLTCTLIPTLAVIAAEEIKQYTGENVGIFKFPDMPPMHFVEHPEGRSLYDYEGAKTAENPLKNVFYNLYMNNRNSRRTNDTKPEDGQQTPDPLLEKIRKFQSFINKPVDPCNCYSIVQCGILPLTQALISPVTFKAAETLLQLGANVNLLAPHDFCGINMDPNLEFQPRLYQSPLAYFLSAKEFGHKHIGEHDRLAAIRWLLSHGANPDIGIVIEYKDEDPIIKHQYVPPLVYLAKFFCKELYSKNYNQYKLPLLAAPPYRHNSDGLFLQTAAALIAHGANTQNLAKITDSFFLRDFIQRDSRYITNIDPLTVFGITGEELKAVFKRVEDWQQENEFWDAVRCKTFEIIRKKRRAGGNLFKIIEAQKIGMPRLKSAYVSISVKQKSPKIETLN